MNIRDFGRHSFVRTTGLVERVRKAEKEKRKMIKYRCKDRFGITGIVEVEGKLFVCKDKNGKDAFEGDKVKVYLGEFPSTLTAKAKIIYSHCQFMAGGIEEDNNKGPWSLDSKHIEIIEEKEND